MVDSCESETDQRRFIIILRLLHIFIFCLLTWKLWLDCLLNFELLLQIAVHSDYMMCWLVKSLASSGLKTGHLTSIQGKRMAKI
jgi:hypothetical protein